MSRGEQTRQAILEQAAQIFSMRGYGGTSLDDLMNATHLTKGGIYNHFGSKDALMLAAFDYATDLVRERQRVKDRVAAGISRAEAYPMVEVLDSHFRITGPRSDDAALQVGVRVVRVHG